MFKKVIKLIRLILITIYLVFPFAFIIQSRSDIESPGEVDGLELYFTITFDANINFAPDELSMEILKAAINANPEDVQLEHVIYIIKKTDSCTNSGTLDVSKIKDEEDYNSQDAKTSTEEDVTGIFERLRTIFKTSETKIPLTSPPQRILEDIEDLRNLMEGEKYGLTFMNNFPEDRAYIFPIPGHVFKLKKYVIVEISMVDAELVELKYPSPIRDLVKVDIVAKSEADWAEEISNNRYLLYSDDLKWIAKSIYSPNDAKSEESYLQGSDFQFFGVTHINLDDDLTAEPLSFGEMGLIHTTPDLIKCQIEGKVAYVIQNKFKGQVQSTESQCSLSNSQQSEILYLGPCYLEDERDCVKNPHVTD
ncbi:hypothetical protein RF11_01825 [Thelohanellus kitauei]|uniref:Uncharacterized protein n=1 Tax=Thelohanellus kitauei TaxID=669202 RepID=A0A0C2MFC3_THEKT|nr:hypothetical protein RF11_01825 [Thelohanellus kitauei]